LPVWQRWKNTDFVMLGREELKLPGVVLLFYKNGDWQYGQNIWRRWIIDHNLMRNSGSRDFKENVYLCSTISSTNVDIKAIKELDKAGIFKKYNCVFEIDAGWYNYSPYGSSWLATGDYSPARKYANDGLKRISDACHEAGAKFSLWMEPERVYFGTPQCETLKNDVLYYYHGHLSYDRAKAENIMPISDCGVINYGEEAVQKYVTELINDTVQKYGIDVYRQDFNAILNDYINPFESYETERLGVPRYSVTHMKYHEGYINTWYAVQAANPELIFDSCAMGGRRNDLETMRFSFIHRKNSYVEDTESAQGQNFGSLSWFPFTGTGFTNMSSKYDVRSRLGLSIGIGAAPSSNYKLIDSALTEWRSLQKYIFKDYYQISDYSVEKTGVLAMQFNDAENCEGMLIGYLRRGGDYVFMPRALDPDAVYKIWDGDNEEATALTLSGEELMRDGFKVSYSKGRAYASVVWYELVKE